MKTSLEEKVQNLASVFHARGQDFLKKGHDAKSFGRFFEADDLYCLSKQWQEAYAELTNLLEKQKDEDERTT